MTAARNPHRPRAVRRRPQYARTRALYPFAWHTPVLVVPGLHGSGPAHWQTQWEARHPEFVRVEQDDFDTPDLDAWAAVVGRAAADAQEPPIVVAHSFGCLATVAAAADGATLAGALLVAPADPARLDLDDAALATALPFPSIVVGSLDDPWLKFIKAGALAARWGARLVSAGHAGHVNADSGLGVWPEGLALLRDVAERAAAAGTLRAPASRVADAGRLTAR